MSDVIIRGSKKTDDFLKIALCIYLTDPFIYPAAFGMDIRQVVCAISKLMHIKDGLFYTDNLVIAIHREEICGILLYNKDGAVWNKDECATLVEGMIPSIEIFRYVSETYFSAKAIAPPQNHIEVIACCVMPEFRNMGIGKHLISWLIEEYPEHILTLDVLANNPAAIRLYKKCGFEIIEKFKGFSLEKSSRPDCYHMIREPDDLGGKNNE